MNVGSRRSLGKRSGAVEHTILAIAAVIFAAVLGMGARSQHPVTLKMLTTVAHSTDSFPRYSIFELSLKHNGVYNNNFLDVTLDVVFTSPSGTQRRVRVHPGRQKLEVPPFTVDLALLVTPKRNRLQLQRAGADRTPRAPEVEKP